MKYAMTLAAVLLAACGVPADDGDGLTDPPPIPVEAERPFTTSELQVAAANNDFAMRLLKDVAAREADPNLLLSPLSASMALGMTMNGAEGATWDSMRDALGFGALDEAAVNSSYRGLIAQLHARDAKVEFRLANSIWYRKGFTVKPAFLDAASANFAARVSALDFADPGAPKTISKWAEDQTGGRIKDLVESIDSNDVMFLVNAVYFKAPWSMPFHPQATRPADFTRSNGTKMQVPTMSGDGIYSYMSNSDVQVVELMYGDSSYSMVLVAPSQPGRTLASLTSSLTSAQWSSWMNALKPGRIMLTMPKFKFDYDITMNDALSALGMGIAFDSRNADFDRINDERDDLYISKVRQKAFIDVHELGTEAAAATSITVSVTSLPPSVNFDRPFLFAIRERSSGAVLFAGRVGDPRY
jgi:serine protease inhibitor